MKIVIAVLARLFGKRYVVVRSADNSVIQRVWGREEALDLASELNEDAMFYSQPRGYQVMHVSAYRP